MSSPPEQSKVWTPDTIANVAYRVVMIIVSLAFIWMTYRRPTSQIRATVGDIALATIGIDSGASEGHLYPRTTNIQATEMASKYTVPSGASNHPRQPSFPPRCAHSKEDIQEGGRTAAQAARKLP